MRRIPKKWLDLWREPPLADLPPAPEVEAEVARLLEQRRAAESDLVGARLALGHHQQILPDLRKAVTRDPLSEHSWAQLMLASYRSRGRAAALAVYGQARGVLHAAAEALGYVRAASHKRMPM
jgi:DNA-binding SARP family transcriptional activator